MRTPARMQPQVRSGTCGFTLVELLVVLLIIGLSLGVVGLTMLRPQDTDALFESADGLVVRGRWGADQAWSGGEPLGLVFVPVADGGEPEHWQYRWYRFRDRIWQPDVVAAENLPDDVEVAIQNAEGDWLDLRKIAAAETLIPVIVFYPGGEAAPVKLVLESRSAPSVQQVIWIDTIGRVETQAERDERIHAKR